MDKLKQEQELQQVKRFGGVFKFTNPTEEDFTVLWNNKEYTFLANTTSPIIISDESLEHIQEIRKKWAYKLAVREFYKGKEYQRLSKMGGGLPPTFDEKILQPLVDKCLTPLPEADAIVRPVKRVELKTRASKAIGEKEDPSYAFREENIEGNIEKLGVQSDTFNG
jgi:hypothetical protein